MLRVPPLTAAAVPELEVLVELGLLAQAASPRLAVQAVATAANRRVLGII
jgi:hypothetical protein